MFLASAPLTQVEHLAFRGTKNFGCPTHACAPRVRSLAHLIYRKHTFAQIQPLRFAAHPPNPRPYTAAGGGAFLHSVPTCPSHRHQQLNEFLQGIGASIGADINAETGCVEVPRS